MFVKLDINGVGTFFFFNENVPSLKSQQAQFVFCRSALARNVRLHKDTSALLGGSGRENIFRHEACYLLLFIKVPFSTKERWCTTLFLPYAWNTGCLLHVKTFQTGVKDYLNVWTTLLTTLGTMKRDVLTAVTIKITALWDVTPRSPVAIYPR